MDLDDKICLCFHVTCRKVVNYVRQTHPKVASQLSECGSAGTGCGWCIPFLEQIYERSLAGELSDLDSILTERYERLRADYVRAGKGTPPPGATPLPGNS